MIKGSMAIAVELVRIFAKEKQRREGGVHLKKGRDVG
jgi:hypothetical protein